MNTRKRIEDWQYQLPDWANIQNKPTTWAGLGLTGTFPFVSLGEQSLTTEQKNQVKTNLEITDSTPVTLGENTNGLSLSGQALQLGLATTLLSGAMSAADKVRVNGANVIQGDGLTVSGDLTNRILGAGNLTFAVNPTVLRVAGTQVITGIKDTRRAGPNDGSTFAVVQRWSIDSGNLYGLELRNTQNTMTGSGQVGWHYAFTYNASAGTPRTREVFGFSRGGILVVGDKDLSAPVFSHVSSQEVANIGDSNWRYPIVGYTKGSEQITDGLILGTDELRTSKIDADTKLYVEGGIRTIAADGATEATVLFGEYQASVNTTVDSAWIVKVGNRVLELKARDITPI